MVDSSHISRKKHKTMRVIQIPALADNYAYLIQCPQTGAVGIVDTPDASLILGAIKRQNLTPQAILNTHHHWDHAGGNRQILEKFRLPVFCSAYDAGRIDGVTRTLKEGDSVQVGELEFLVLDVPGHTLGHIAYYGHGAVFCGDTLFVGGCGRLFEGMPEQMLASLKKLKQLPDETKVYCAHEYTEKNLIFALTLEPDNQALREKYERVRELRQKNRPTVPSSIGEEKSCNPFLRWDSEDIIAHLKQKKLIASNDPVGVFAAVRRLKDAF